MTEPDPPSHAPTYERPGTRLRCGRTRTWDRPCWQGPSARGACGGSAECDPIRAGDRWECRRPQWAGGGCDRGPRPDGTCPLRRPACVPRLTVHALRGRLGVLALVAVVAALAAFARFESPAQALALDAGPLSSAHAAFTAEGGCATCHAAHERPALEWLAAAFAGQDLSGQCLQCHAFGAHDRAAHNTAFAHRDDVLEPRCTACHSEHKGRAHAVAQVSDRICANCHEPRVSGFTTDHPPFSSGFPHETPDNVSFDHVQHLGTYFAPGSRWMAQADRDPEFAELARARCTACHAVEGATREVAPLPFEATCVRCHAQEITSRPLVVLDPWEVTPILGAVLDVDPDDAPEAAEERAGDLLATLSDEGVDGFARLLAERSDAVAPARLLEGLEPGLVKAAAAAWREPDREFDAPEPSPVDPGGWRAGEDDDGNQSLRYHPRRHADPVLVAWIDYLAALADAAGARDGLLDESSGAGACGKCHRSGLTRDAGAAPARWRYSGPAPRAHTTFSHVPHINVMGPDTSCGTCHVLSAAAGVADAPRDRAAGPGDFQPIAKALCERCHADEPAPARDGAGEPGASHERVAVACATCHRYHREPGFRRELGVLGRDRPVRAAAPAAPSPSASGRERP